MAVLFLIRKQYPANIYLKNDNFTKHNNAAVVNYDNLDERFLKIWSTFWAC